MKSPKLMRIYAIVLFTGLVIPVGLAAQGQSMTTDLSRLSLEQQSSILRELADDLPRASSHQLAKLTASDGGPLDQLGLSVAVSGDTVVASAPYATERCGRFCGYNVAYVFVKPASGWANITETAELSTSDHASLSVVSISGDTIVAGNPYVNSYEGAAYVFVKPTGGWRDTTETAKLTASDGHADDFFGNTVSVSGNTVVVGMPQNVNNNQGPGAAYVFVKPANGWTNMTQTGKLTASDGKPHDDLGFAVDISGNTVVVGAPNVHAARGAAYVFVKPASTWTNMTQTAKLTASDGDRYDGLGISISISGGTVVAGAPNESASRHDGGVYVFLRPSSGWADETETAKLINSDGKSNDQFGYSVTTNGNVVVAGAPQHFTLTSSGQGEAYLFLKPKQGWANRREDQKLFASDGKDGDSFGTSVFLSNKTAVIGATQHDNQGSHGPGAAYVFGTQ